MVLVTPCAVLWSADEATALRAAGDEEPASESDGQGSEIEGFEEDTVETAAALAAASAVVHLYAANPEFWFARPDLIGWLGTYDRERLLDGQEWRVNGRYCYAMRWAPDRMLWWANGYWHAGLRSHVGEQTALLIAGDAALVPEQVAHVWMWYENGHWVPSSCRVHCAAGPFPARVARWALKLSGGVACAALCLQHYGALLANCDYWVAGCVVGLSIGFAAFVVGGEELRRTLQQRRPDGERAAPEW